ncbi:MAG: ATP-binding protein [Alphaproteobacteria bacterium]|nr:ATP-binding protein [Alphaproteobacteria bacterium]
MFFSSRKNSLKDSPSFLRVIETDDSLGSLSARDFDIDGLRSPLALAFISPHVDFAQVTTALRRLAGITPIVAVSTAGELGCCAKEPLYKPTGAAWSSVVVQIFPADLLEKVSIHRIPLPNEDIRLGAPSLGRDARVVQITQSLESVAPSFPIDVRDTIALTFIDGLSSCENYFMEAVYRSGNFPCLFIGGSAGGKLDFKHTYIFDGNGIVENYAIVLFLKLREGRSYGVFKTQNFEKTGQSFVVIEADPDRRIATAVADPVTREVKPFIQALAETFQTTRAEVMAKLTGYTFGIEIDKELFVRSVYRIDNETGSVSFFCDINPGDKLELLKATDFVEQTNRDLADFLKDRPSPLGAILNDCILRRLNNEPHLAELSRTWPMPVAGFSTFGELFGININQTLTALVFFDTTKNSYRDRFIAEFPVHYARFFTYFTRRLELSTANLIAVRKKLEDTERAKQSAVQEKLQIEKKARFIQLLRRVAASANSAVDIEDAIRKCLQAICELMQCPIGHAYEWSSKKKLLLPTGLWYLEDEERFKAFVELTDTIALEQGRGLPGHVWEQRAPVWDLDFSYSQDCPRCKLAVTLGIRAGFAFPITLGNATPYVLEFFSPEVTEQNDEFLEVLKDISDQLTQVILRTRLQTTLRDAKDAAERATATKSDFLANMSHELRTPLNSVIGMLRLLKDEGLEKTSQELVDTAFLSSTNLLEIVNDILDLSKIESGDMTLEHIGIDLMYILNSAFRTIGRLADEKRVGLIKHYENESFPYVFGDPTRLTQVLINLIGNAVKYTDKGHVDVRATFTKRDDKNIEFRCEITDTGIGIPKEKQRDVFNKFVQADTSTTRRYGGTGLGLAITKELVASMWGEIGVESEIGAGSTFWFTIPFEIAAELNSDEYDRRIKMFSGTIPPEKARILVAEDHPLNQILITRVLERFGIRLFELVNNGCAAVDRYRDASWDIILMDCHMPEKNGYDATEDIRKLEKETGAHTPIVAMTANAMVGEKEKCLRYGMDEYISKPINIDELKEVLGQWVQFPNDSLPDPPSNAAPENQKAVEPSPIDLTQLRTFTEGDESLEKELIRIFVQQSDENLQTLGVSRIDGACKAWVEAAHMFKGGAASIGAVTLSALCAKAQNMPNCAKDERAAIFTEIADAYENVKEYLKKMGLLL